MGLEIAKPDDNEDSVAEDDDDHCCDTVNRGIDEDTVPLSRSRWAAPGPRPKLLDFRAGLYPVRKQYFGKTDPIMQRRNR